MNWSMNIAIQEIYYFAVVLVMLKGFSLVYDSFLMRNVIAYKPSLKRSANKMLQALSDKNVDEVFRRVGINLSIQKYTAYRNILMLTIIIMAAIKGINNDVENTAKLLVYAAGIYMLTYPKDTFRGYKTPFKYLFDMIYASRLAKKDEELMSVISQMKNLILSRNSNSISTDYIFTRLIDYTNISKHNFIQALALIRKGERSKAEALFAKDFGTKLGSDFSKIMVRLDYLPATEFLEQITILQESVKGKRQTLKEQKMQRKKMTIYVLAALELSLIIFNYIYIVLFDTMQIMRF